MQEAERHVCVEEGAVRYLHGYGRIILVFAELKRNMTSITVMNRKRPSHLKVKMNGYCAANIILQSFLTKNTSKLIIG